MNTKRPYAVAIGAVVRRMLVILLAGFVTWILGAWPDALLQALKSNPATLKLVPVAYLFIEFIQKWLRETKAQKKAAL